MREWLTLLGVFAFIAGFGLIFAGSIGQGNFSSGGVVFIGPIPIVFGSGPGGQYLALGSVVIGGIMICLVILWSWRLSKTSRGGGPESIK